MKVLLGIFLLINSLAALANANLDKHEGVYKFERSEGNSTLVGFESEVEVKFNHSKSRPRLVLNDLSTGTKISYPLKGCRTESDVVDSYMLFLFRMIDKSTMCAEASESSSILKGTLKVLSYSDVLFIDPAHFIDEEDLNRSSFEGRYEIEFSGSHMVVKMMNAENEVLTQFIYVKSSI